MMKWTSTDVSVAAGDLVLVSARGKVSVGAWLGERNADALDEQSGPCAKKSPREGTLMVKIGTGAAFAAGSNLIWRSDQSGPLKARISDSRYEDNKGDLDVDVTVIPAAAFAAAPAEAEKITVASTNDEWTQAKLTVAPGDLVLVSAPGHFLRSDSEVGADGATFRTVQPACGKKTQVSGTLMMKVGTGAGFPIGASFIWFSDQAGQVKFRINEGGANFKGDLAVELVRLPAAALSAASSGAPTSTSAGNSCDANAGFTPYTNGRFGFTIDVPKNLVAQEPPANGDGQVWLSDDGVSLRASGSLHVIPIDDSFATAANASGVSYKVKKKDWFVVSGIANARVFYRKVIQIGDIDIDFEFSYPVAKKADCDRLIDRISRSFK